MSTEAHADYRTLQGYESRKRLGLLVQADMPAEVKAEVTKSERKAFRRELSREESEILARMEAVQLQMSKTIQHVGGSLENHFKNIPEEKLHEEIEARFKMYDLDKNGTLDREEICEAMAEMGHRPSAEELEEFFTLFDTDKNGTIDMMEFEQMVRIKLHLMEPDSIVHSPGKSPEKDTSPTKEVHFEEQQVKAHATQRKNSAPKITRPTWNKDVHG
mmetsp:Transcript_55361/g.129562  ORF Transcript_55361/g.129562 Transcript_55361/m.129562 type:complete len:217 (+) Transcript_55361:71-721(+)